MSVEKLLQVQPMVAAHTSAFADSGPVTSVYVQALTKVKSNVLHRRVSVEEKFADFDRMCSGKVTQAQFKRGLEWLCQGMNSAMPAEEVEAIVQHYLVTKQNEILVNWREFAHHVNEVYSYKIAEKSPDAAPTDPSQFLTTVKDYQLSQIKHSKKQEIALEEAELLHNTLHRLRDSAAKRRILLKPYFKDHDKLNRGAVTSTQFRRILSVLGWELADDVMELMLWKYSSTIDSDAVDYMEFLKDVEPAMDVAEDGTTTVKKMRLERKNSNSQGPQLQRVLTRIQSIVLKRRLFLSDMFFDFDRLRCGCVPSWRFEAVLKSAAQLDLSDAEMKVLCQQYTQRKHINSTSTDEQKVNYHRFCVDVQRAFVPIGIEANPSQTVQTLELSSDAAQVDDEYDEYEVNEKEQEQTDAVLMRLVSECDKKGIDHKPFFQAYDKTHRGYISNTQFASVLHTLGLRVTEDELSLIQKRFRKSEDRVRYFPFCQVLDQNQPKLQAE